MYKLIFFVPPSHKESVKNALFEIGVGKFNNYEHCSFESLGDGQFKPIKNALPHIGVLNKLEVLKEYKVEMVCEDSLIKKAVKTLKKAHPYEEVAFEVYKLEDF